ncbi:hypothetical protein DQ384_15940 [Sphaerisporangium album]|uniref:Antitoxin n=1 Tax=Sphaerisporangium album TaxID=509200 RepID=A0A367FKJ8_9ACTN|nr:hypothetical protein DQ384_15940 [Sphaerisporangium album]
MKILDVPEEVVEILKSRAAASGMSLTTYLRERLCEEAAIPSIEEVMAKIATDDPIPHDPDLVQEALRDGRR